MADEKKKTNKAQRRNRSIKRHRTKAPKYHGVIVPFYAVGTRRNVRV